MLLAIRMTSAVYKMKSRGHNTEPCGTPHANFRVDDLSPKNVTAWVLSLRKDRIQFKAAPVMPNDSSIRRRRMSWSTVSKAALRSSSPIKETCPESAASRMSDTTLRMQLSVEWSMIIYWCLNAIRLILLCIVLHQFTVGLWHGVANYPYSSKINQGYGRLLVNREEMLESGGPLQRKNFRLRTTTKLI